MPARYAPYLFGFLLSGFMSLIVSGVATWRALGLTEGFFGLWMGAWMSAWPVAFVALLVVRPAVQRIVEAMVR